MSVESNVRAVRERIERACAASGRDGAEVSLMAVVKSATDEGIRAAYNAGVKLFGANRVKGGERLQSYRLAGAKVCLVGHLQRRAAKRACKLFSRVDTLDSAPLALELDRRGAKECLVQLNITRLAGRSGALPEQLDEVFEIALGASFTVQGLFGVGPYPVEEKKSRAAFALLARERERCRETFGLSLPVLSAGMTEDLEYAVAEGATEVRVGRGIFAPCS